ncbi:MAG: RNA-binding protein [Gammaproteobacteria bacterium]|nr:RNA-binding protein [Gammaproteobacteria bacterium]
MSIYFPSIYTLIRGLIVTIVITLIAYFVYPILGLLETNTGIIFTAGILIGSLVMLLLSSLYTDKKIRTMTLYVGNLAFKTGEGALRELFGQYGQVQSVRIMKDRLTRKPRGFAFVEIERSAGRAASKHLDGYEFNGRILKVNNANQRKQMDD